MLVYWALFAFFAVGAFSTVGNAAKDRPTSTMFLVGMLIIALAIGLRFEVGADWYSYLGMFKDAGRFPLERLLRIGDPSYQLLNWIARQTGSDIWLVNTLCGLIFAWGLYRFCQIQPSPWLAATVSIPYLVIVVAMGYSRQAVALGILMAGLARVARGGSVLGFIPYVAIAGSFHATAVIMFPLVSLATERNRLVNVALVIFSSYFLYDAFIGNGLDRYMYVYVQRSYSSQGAAIRVAMNTIAALLFWIASKRMGFSREERNIWRNFSLAALGLVVVFFVFPSSTAVDRVALYLIPLQIAVLTRIAFAGKSSTAGVFSVVGYMAAVQFVWLNFAQHARYWLPYQFFPF